MSEYDPVNRPKHYNVHPSGIECIQITEHMTFCAGNVFKYLWRAGLKDLEKDSEAGHLQDMKKARWYLEREIARLSKVIGDQKAATSKRPARKAKAEPKRKGRSEPAKR